tara:strand:+ start:3032 stop:3499 length:468 start_codon:yes stop_codon:yes gene_type:complete
MKLNKIKFLNIIFLLTIIFFSNSVAEQNSNFLSLKNNTVYLRQGPSFDYPIKLTYKKKFLPIVILEKLENWRKIKDLENNSGWIHISQLSKKKSAINTENNALLYKKNTIYSKPIARLEAGRLVLIKNCKLKFCKITTEGHTGWISKKFLWGKIN